MGMLIYSLFLHPDDMVAGGRTDALGQRPNIRRGTSEYGFL